MENAGEKLRIVKIMEPELCLSCRFGQIATVEMADGTSRCMLHCTRLDCDQWVTVADSETPERIVGDTH